MKQKIFVITAFTLLLFIAATGSLVYADRPLIRIMPLGDSITQGDADHDSYRRALWELLVENSKRVEFVGSLKTNFPYSRLARSDFDTDHEGHWGWRADEVLARIDGWARQAAPDIVLIHLGTNDILQRQNVGETVDELKRIITALRKANTEIKVLLAQLIPVANQSINERIEEFNELLTSMAKKAATAGSPVYIVDQHEGFDAFKDTYDGLHPNASGINKMARNWYKALASIPDFDMFRTVQPAMQTGR